MSGNNYPRIKLMSVTLEQTFQKLFLKLLKYIGKVEIFLKVSLDSIPSLSVKIQIMSRKVSLRCKEKTVPGVVNFGDITQQCFALLPQVNFPENNLNFLRRGRGWN